MLGNHVIKTWSTTQSVVSISSGEAEYYAMVKGASCGIGVQAMVDEMSIKVGLRLNTDASAAIGIAMGRGVGKVKHIAVSQLWLQEKVFQGAVEVVKVRSGDNVSVALTKKVSSHEMQWHLDQTSQSRHGKQSQHWC